ncbi:MAG: DMT family transporter [Casimicrobiaceae bacterium]
MTHSRAILALHLAVGLFGVAGLFGVWLALPPAQITLGRAAIAALALGIVARSRGERATPNLRLCLNGAILAVHWTAFFAAISASGVAVGLLGFATFPLFVVLLERFLLGRAFDRASIATMALVCVGLAVIAGVPAAGAGSPAGLGWGVVAGASFAWLAVRNRAHVRDMPPISIALWQDAFAALWLLPVLLVTPTARMPLASEWLLLLALGIVFTALAHTLFIASMRRLSAHTASVIAALEPVYAIVLAALLLHQVPSAAMLAGGALIVVAAIVASRRPSVVI